MMLEAFLVADLLKVALSVPRSSVVICTSSVAGNLLIHQSKLAGIRL